MDSDCRHEGHSRNVLVLGNGRHEIIMDSEKSCQFFRRYKKMRFAVGVIQ
jgi:hypothetical protein